MSGWLVASVLLMGLIWAGLRLRSHRREVKILIRAMDNGLPALDEEGSAGKVKGWGELSGRVNGLLEELSQTKRQRSGQLAQLEATLGSLREAVLVVDGGNYVQLANQALQEIFPEVENILGKRLELALHSVEFFGYVDAVRREASMPQRTFEFVHGDRVAWLEITGTQIAGFEEKHGGKLCLFVLHDITKQKALEGVRRDFVANVSHELRTPLSVIKGYVETLVDGQEGMTAAERVQFLKTIQRHADRLHALLEDLLTLSRLESINPGLQRESVDVPALARSMIDDYQQRPSGGKHDLQLIVVGGPSPHVLDPLKITQVLENLLDNALKYTPPGAKITLTVSEEEEGLKISVKDNGPGIPEADLPHIFERFYRVDKGRSRESGGTGLGLSIVKHIVQLHGGKVRCESRLGEGACFSFTLPRR